MLNKQSPNFARDAKFGLLFCCVPLSYLTTDWKSGEVRRLANWLSEEE